MGRSFGKSSRRRYATWSFRPRSGSRYEAAFARFASVFPDTFYVTERGRYFPDDSADKGRLLSAGYHSVVGFFRDDTPLMELILDEKGQTEIDRLWDEFDFIANFTARTWTQYFFNQSGEVRARALNPARRGRRITRSRIRRSSWRCAMLIWQRL